MTRLRYDPSGRLIKRVMPSATASISAMTPVAACST
ncbi:hypothetical protein [Pseudomonas sp. CBS]